MARFRRRSRRNPLVSFFGKDPFGLTWFTLLLVAVLIAKWWRINPPAISEPSCLGCVTAIAVAIAALVTSIISLFWVLWRAKRQKKNILMVFLITLLVLGCTALFDVTSHEILGRLYYRGWLPWEEADITYLLDDFLPHSAGLYLGVLMVYAMARIAFDSGFSPRKYIIPINAVFAAAASFLLFMGILLY